MRVDLQSVYLKEGTKTFVVGEPSEFYSMVIKNDGTTLCTGTGNTDLAARADLVRNLPSLQWSEQDIERFLKKVVVQ